MSRRRTSSSRRRRGSAAFDRRPRGGGGDWLLAWVALASPVWVVALRSALPDLLGLTQAAPDVLLAAVVAAAWMAPREPAVLFAAAAGLLADAASGLPWGLSGARLGLLAMLLGHLRQGVDLQLPGTRVLLLAVCATGERCLAALSLKALLPQVELAPLLERSWQVGLLTALLAPLAFRCAATLGGGAGGR